MKRAVFLSAIILLISDVSLGQESNYLKPAGGEQYTFKDMDELSDNKRKEIEQFLAEKINELHLKNVSKNLLIPSSIKFAFPLKVTEGFIGYNFYGISNFVDHDSGYGSVLDYNGGRRSYDVAGYNHTGTDFFLYPFWWTLMDSDYVQVTAAYPGIILDKSDGNYDKNCYFNNYEWNAIYIQHSDGTVAWYGHLKNHSITSKAIGETVEQGEYLGLVGSSGQSTGPHLHFEVHSPENNIIDPFSGKCNPSVSESWWTTQREYYSPQINKLMTHGRDPYMAQCYGNGDHINGKNIFSPGDTIYFAVYYTDEIKNMQTDFQVIQPDGTPWVSWHHSMPLADTFYAASYWYWRWVLPSDIQQGRYKFAAHFNGTDYSHNFRITGPADITQSSVLYNFRLYPNYPNPFNPSTKIDYEIAEPGFVELKVYDLLGNELSTIVNRYQPAGNYQVEFNAEKFSAGIYLCSLSSGKYNMLQKMLLIK